MRLHLLAIFMLLYFLQSHASANAQRISLDHKDAPLSAIFEDIRLQSQYDFLYNFQTLKNSKRVTIKASNVTVPEVLEKIFANQPLTYVIDQNVIIIKQKPFVTLFPPAVRDTFTVTGSVSDTVGALVGVTIQVEGKNRMTSSGQRGEFSIKVDSNDVLLFTFVGYEPQKFRIRRSQALRVKMKPTDSELEKMVVVAYGKQKQAAVTGAGTTVNPESFALAPRSNFQESLQGNVAGLMSLSGDGTPGSLSDVTIRGLGSITASNAPLYIIDGVAVLTGDITGYNTNALASLNDDDIESIRVLKDAAATSIYGSRGSNGVVIITTKKGKPGKTVFNVNAQAGVNQYTLTPKSEPLNTHEMLTLLREGWNNSGRDPGAFAQAVVDAGIDYTRNTKWIDELMRIGNFQRYDLSASGGNDRNKFYASVGMYQSEGAQRGIDYRRLSGRLNIDNKLSERLSFTSSLSFSTQRSNSTLRDGYAENPTRAMNRLQPWLKVYNDDGSYDYSYYISGFNPVAVIDKNLQRSNTHTIVGSIGATYKILPKLSFETKQNAELIFTDQIRFVSPEFGDGRAVNGRGTYGNTKNINLYSTNLLRYKTDIGMAQEFSIFGGYETQKVTREGTFATATNFLPNTNTLENASRPTSNTSYRTSNALVSYFANAAWSWNRKYYVDATIRRDGSSRFGHEKRFANFWSAGVAWDIARETFMTPIGLINNLKFRSSYGISGNQEIGDFPSIAQYQPGNDYDGNPGYIFNQYENPQLTWESAHQFNVGMEFRILNSRVSGSVDYFSRKTDGLLYNLPISSSNGVTNLLSNQGALKNIGVEVELTSKNIVARKAGGFSWTTEANFTWFKNRILRLESAIEDQELALNSFTLANYAGVDPATGEALWFTNNTKSTLTTNWASAGRYNQGTALPKYYGGITNTFSYKRFTLRTLIYYNFGNKVYDSWGSNAYTDGSLGFSDIGAMPRYIYDRRWQKPGDITDVPKVVFLGTQSGLSNQSSTRFLYDGGYIRLRDVALSYSFTNRFTSKLKLSRMSAFIKANNLFTWVEDDRLRADPEVNTAGYLDYKPPVFRTLTIGLSLQF